MTRNITLVGTSNWLFDNLASCFNYDTASPRAAEFDTAISLIWFVQEAFDDNGGGNLAYCLRLHSDHTNEDGIWRVSVRQWLDLLAKGIQQYTDPTVRSTLHALSECLYAYLSDIGALEMARDAKLG